MLVQGKFNWARFSTRGRKCADNECQDYTSAGSPLLPGSIRQEGAEALSQSSILGLSVGVSTAVPTMRNALFSLSLHHLPS